MSMQEERDAVPPRAMFPRGEKDHLPASLQAYEVDARFRLARPFRIGPFRDDQFAGALIGVHASASVSFACRSIFLKRHGNFESSRVACTLSVAAFFTLIGVYIHCRTCFVANMRALLNIVVRTDFDDESKRSPYKSVVQIVYPLVLLLGVAPPSLIWVLSGRSDAVIYLMLMWMFGIIESLVSFGERMQKSNAVRSAGEFPWATLSDLQTAGHAQLVGKRIRLSDYEFNVRKYISEGKSARTFMVSVDMPESYRNVQLVLKVEKFHFEKPLEKVSHEAHILRLVEGAPHAMQMVAYGKLRSPGYLPSAFFDQKSSYTAMLVTVAPGSKLVDAMDSMTLHDRGIATEQLWAFANDMLARRISHGDLNHDNVFWDSATMKITVIDFGNAFVWSDKPSYKQFIKQRRIGNAEREMHTFLEVKLEWH